MTEKLSHKFYEDIEAEIEYYMETFDGEDVDYDYIHGTKYYDGRTETSIDDIELPDGYTADVELSVYVSATDFQGDYDNPPEYYGSYEWEVTHLEIFDKDGDLIEVLNRPTDYMSGKYEF